MSVFANYDTMCTSYDEGRIANGAHLYLGLIYALSGKLAQDVYLLDAGCGTGNHVKYLLEHGLGRAAIFDASAGMLEKARAKLSAYVADGRVAIQLHALPDIPHPDATFDAVMFNQCLQHLDALDDINTGENSPVHYTFPEVARASLQEAYRVLKPGGVLIVNATAPHQLEEGHWYFPLFPEALASNKRRTFPPESTLDVLKQVGFVRPCVLVLPHELLWSAQHYYRQDGLLMESWRSAVSCVATASNAELKTAAAAVRDMTFDGKMAAFLATSDDRRRKVGQFTIYIALKEEQTAEK